MKRPLHIIASLLLTIVLCGTAFAQQAPTRLTTMDFSIVGIGLNASPDYQAVPKGIASQVLTNFYAPGMALPPTVIDQLPKDFKVTAELTGPAFSTPLQLATTPGQPFNLPTLPLLGKYTLSNIKLYDGTGKFLFGASPQTVTIDSISDPLITSVTTRQLTVQELQDRGVTFDNTNFTAYEFTAAIGTESKQQPLSFPVLIPNTVKMQNPEDLPPPGNIGLPTISDRNSPPELPANISLDGFTLSIPDGEEKEGEDKITLPPIPGIIVIPNNIGFLHQYFSALLMVTNGAPGMSGLVVKDLSATITLPPGDDTVPATNQDLPGDDPLRMAKGVNGYFPFTQAIMNPGPDGKIGTADDSGLLRPAESGQSDFTIEGLKEGTHKIDFNITATLEGLPIGPVTIKGKASGAVLVRNPDFSITLGHPDTVRSGEAYDLFITITNTSKSLANLVSTHLDSHALSGAAFAPGEDPDRQIDTILPGSSATVKYRLISQRTGRVTATAFASEDVKGRFILRAGVGELGIPLSPDTLVLPYTGSLNEDLVNAAVGLLGQAWSVATAPAGALPADVLPIGKKTITARANDLSEAGMRVLIGDRPVKAVEDLAFDFIGSDNANPGFDSLRRRSTQGLNLNNAIAGVFQQEIAASDLFTFQAGYADQASYRPPHISVITSEAPVRVQVADAFNNRTGGLAAAEAFRDIPYSDQLVLSTTDAGRSTLSLITRIDSASYRVDLAAEADATLDIGLVVPDASGVLQQFRFEDVSLASGNRAWITLLPNTSSVPVLNIDTNNDGVAESTLAVSSTLVVPDSGPRLVAATQLSPGFGPGGDKHGRNVAVLFSERVTKETAQNIANYAVEENAVKLAYLQESGRMAFLMLRDGIGPYFGTLDPSTGNFLGRAITVSGLLDQTGKSMPAPDTMPIRITVQGPGAVVSGTIRTAQGTPIAGATVRLLQLIRYLGSPAFAIYSEKQVNEAGFYRFEYVYQNDDPPGGFMIEGVDPETQETGQTMAGVMFNEQQLTLDVFMKARGSVNGTVRDAAGSPVPGAAVQLSPLNDVRTYYATTDALGSFSFSNVRVGPFKLKAVNVALYAEGQIMGTLPDDGGSVTQDVTIFHVADVARGNIAGKIVDLAGNPRADVIVVVNSANYANWTRTAADGTYSFTGVFAGTVHVSARDSTSGEQSSVTGVLTEGANAVFNIILKGTATLTCTVEREDNLSPQGFYVVASAPGGARWAVVTDTNGKAVFENIPVGDIQVSVPDPRNQILILAQGTVSVQSPGENVNITLVIPFKSFSTGKIEGTVRKKDGSVRAFAEVRLTPDVHGTKYKAYTADKDGHYVIPDPDPAKNDVLPLGSYYLIVRNGTEIANGQATLWYDGQKATVNLEPVPVGTVKGTIYNNAGVNPDGTPNYIPAGADVMLYSMKPNLLGWLEFKSFPFTPTATVKSDPQYGSYMFTGVYGGPVTVYASNIFKPTLVSKTGKLQSNDETLTFDLTLVDTFGSISGYVMMPDGSTPVGEGVAVSLSYGSPAALVTVTTGTDGHFAFEPVIPAGNYSILVEDHTTTLTAKTSVTVAAGKDVPVTIRLLGKGTMTVRVLNANGTPAAGASVDAKGTSFPTESAAGITDGSGETTFYNLPEGNYAVSATGSALSGGLSSRTQGNIPGHNASVTAVVTLAPSGTVTGRFLKQDGTTPVKGGQIKLMNAYHQAIAFSYSSSEPGHEGEFTIPFVPIGDFGLEGFDPITDRKGTGGGKLTAEGQVTNADLIITPQGTVRGMVLNNAGTAPIDNAAVNISVSGVTNWAYNTVSQPDGGFLFAGVPAGKFTITAVDPDTNLRGSSSGAITYEGETASADIRLQPSGSISGQVLMPDGTPATDITVAYVASPGSMAGVMTTQVDDQGFYRFDRFAAGQTYNLLATKLGTHDAGRGTATIVYEGEVAKADITLQGTGYIEGFVYDSDGKTVLESAKVMMSAIGKNWASYANAVDYSNADGSFRFTDVPVGSFTLQATANGRITAAAASGGVTADGQTASVNLVLGPVGTITGTILMADGATPAAGGGARYTGCGKIFTGIIGTSGIFTFEPVPLCENFDLFFQNAAGIGIGKFHGSLTENGQVFDIGTIVLDDKAIAINGIEPLNGAVDVPVDSTISLIFSEKADPKTVSSSTVRLAKGSTSVPCSVSLSADGTTVTLKPSAPLLSFTLYTVTVTTGVTDLIGRTLQQTFTSTFTTIDTIPPVVQKVDPVNGAIEVALDGVVRVTFSEPVDPAFTSGIVLLLGSTHVDTRFDLVQGNTVAILTPLSVLQPNATYSVSVSGVRDSVGNLMAGSSLTSFNTVDTVAPSVTDLTVAGDLVKGNTVSFTAAASDTDIAFVDFFLENQLVATDATAPYIQSVVLPKDGMLHLHAVAQDRAGNRGLAYPQPDLVLTVAPDKAPNVVITSPLSGSTVNSGSAFSVAVTANDDLQVKTITLEASGAVVSTQTRTNNSGKEFKPNFSLTVPDSALPGSDIILSVIAKDSAGQTGTSTPMTLKVRDGISPVVSLVTPGSGQKYKPGDTGTVAVTASDNIGVTGIIFTATGAVSTSETRNFSPAAGSVNEAFTFTVPQNAGSNADIVLSALAVDATGNQKSATVTIKVADIVPPAVVWASLQNNSTSVPVNAPISVLFTEPLAASTLTTGSVTLITNDAAKQQIAGTVALSTDGKIVTFAPSGTMTKGTSYKFVIVGTIADIAGNQLGTDYVLTFTTSSVVDNLQPQVESMSPASGLENVPLSARMQATFSKPVNPLTVTSSSFYLSPAVSGAISVSGDGLVATFTPAAPLLPNSTYTLYVTTAVKDTSGNALYAQKNSTFTTGKTLADSVAPVVSDVSPLSGAAGVPVNANVVIRFSEPIAASTVGNQTVLVSMSGVPLAGDLSLEQNGTVIRYKPSNLVVFAANAIYEVTVTSGLTDLAGNALTNGYTSFFSTGSGADSTAPAVASTTPASGSQAIGLNDPVTITFTEPLTAASVNGTTVWLTGNGVSGLNNHLPGSLILSADRKVVTFAPADPYFAGKSYTINVSGVEDAAKNTLNSASFSFTTVIAAGTSTSGLPTAATVLANPTTLYADGLSTTTIQITNIAKGSTVVPNGTRVGVTVSPAYRLGSAGGSIIGGEAATDPRFSVFTTLGGAITLTYQSPALAEQLPTEVKYAYIQVAQLDAGNNPMDSIATSTSVALVRGRTAEISTNPTSLRVGAGSSAEVTIAVKDYYGKDAAPGTVIGVTADPIYNGSSLGGSILGGTVGSDPRYRLFETTTGGLVTLTYTPPVSISQNGSGYIQVVSIDDSGQVSGSLGSKSISLSTTGGYTAPQPQVLVVSPANGSVGVPLNGRIAATFSQALAPATVTSANFSVTKASVAVSGTLSLSPDGKTVSFAPGSLLTPDTTYTVYIGMGLQNAAGSPLLNSGSKTFTTGTAEDRAALAVTGTSPSDGASGVGTNAAITVRFNKQVNAASIDSGSLTVSSGGMNIGGKISLNAESATDPALTSATFTPDRFLDPQTVYTVQVSTGVTDLAGNAMAAAFTSTFTTSGGIDNFQPQVVSISPASGLENVPLSARMQATFSKPVNPLTVTSSSFYLSPAVSGAIGVSGDGLVATFTPAAPLLPNSTYTLYVTTAVKDTSGNALYAQKNSTFTTGKTLADSVAPVVSDVSPLSGAAGVPVNANVVIRFSEPIAASTVGNQTVLVSMSGVPLAGDLSLEQNGTVIRYKPSNLVVFAANAIYEVTVTSGLTDLAGNALTNGYTSFFSTGSGADSTAPAVASTTPASGSQAIGLNDPVTITFTEPLTAASVNGTTVWLTGNGVSGLNNHLPGSLILSADRKVVTFAPADPYFAGKSYTINVSGVEDAAKNTLNSASFSFTTVIAAGTSTSGLPTAATVLANPTTLYADGLSTTTIQITNIAKGSTVVPNGTRVGVTVSPAYRLGSAGGSIIGGEAATDPRFSVFTTLGGAITLTYQSPALAEQLPTEVKYAYIQVAQLDAGNNPMDSIATSTSVALVRGRTAEISTNPTSLRVGAGSSAEVTIAVKDYYGKDAAPGTVIGVTADPIYNGSSLGGSILGGTVGSDPRYRLFETTTGGLVTLTYTPPVSISQNGSGYIQVVSIDDSGQVSGSLGSKSISLSTTGGYTAPQPQVLVVSPANGSVGVPLNGRIAATFSQALAPATVTSANFSVTKASVAVSGTLSLSPDGKTVSFAPGSLLTPDTTYTVYIGMGLQNAAGSPLLNSGSKTFTTGTAEDRAALAVTGTSPSDGASGVGTNAAITVRFNKQVNAASIDSGSLTVSSGGMNIGGKISLNAESATDPALTSATFTPDRFLDPQTVYTVQVSTGVTDVAGNAMAAAFTSTFTTSGGIDNFQPQVVSISPASGLENVPLSARMQATFSKPVNPLTVTSSSFYLSPAVSGAIGVSGDGLVATFTPAAPLLPNSTYTLYVTTAVKDTSGNALYAQKNSTFTTGKTLADSVAPVVSDVSPLSGAAGVPVNANVVIRFSEPIAASTVGNQTVLVSMSGVPLAGDLSLEQNGTVIRYKPSNLVVFAANAIYEVTVTSGLTDLAGNALTNGYTSFFSTGSGADSTAPAVASTTPASGSQAIGLNDPVTITFTEPLTAASVNGTTVWLTGNGVSGLNNHLPGSLILSADRKVVTFAPADPYFAGKSYTINVSGVEDAAKNTLNSASFSFTTVIAAGTSTSGLPTAATVLANPTTLYADGLSTTTIQITNIAKGSTVVPNGTRVGVTVSPAYRLGSAGGSIIGGEAATDPRFSVFTTLGGAITLTYQSPASGRAAAHGG